MTRPEWSTACLDWEDRILSGRPLINGPLFVDEAQEALDVYNELLIVDAPGSPKMGAVSRQWVTDFVSSIFGAYDADSGRRLITEFFLLISKKNSKSTSAAGIMLTALIRNWRMSAEFLIIAPTIEIANNSFYPARDMVRNDEDLSAILQVQDHYRTITHRQTQATLKVIAADNEAVSGKKATGVLVDELWLFGKKPNAENMLREATGGLASRPEGFTIFLSTQSDDAPAGVFKQKLDYARGVRDGRIADDRFLPVIYEFPDSIIKTESKNTDENLDVIVEKIKTGNLFHVTNPNLGASVDPEFLTRELQKAENDGKASLCGFLAKHMNIEIGLNLKSDRWPGADYWSACAGVVTLEDLLTRCEVVVAGVDGGGLDDLLGLCVLGREVETRKWLHWTHAWTHPIALERRKSEAARYRDFEKDGDLTIVREIGEDVFQVGECIQRCEDSGLLDRIGVDPVGIGDIVDELLSRDIEVDRIVGVPQGWRLTGAIKTTERRLAEGTIEHAGQALMAWCAGNAKIEPRGNAVIITKQASGTGKIDPLIATFNAAALMAMNPEARGGPSVYEKRGILVLG
jgi:phage terminase large subunit-like protein